MADTPSNGETASQGTVSNDVSQVSTPAGDNANSAEVGRLRKELEQKTMRENQLANELEQKRKAEETAKAEQLREKEEFKTLYEQTQSRLNEMETNAEAERKRQQLGQATQDILKEYPDTVKDLAATAGLSLNDDTEEAKTELKGKLDDIKSKVAPTSTVTANNPRSPAPSNVDKESLVARSMVGGESPMALAGARGDPTVAFEYIRQLPAIQRMREIANDGQ